MARRLLCALAVAAVAQATVPMVTAAPAWHPACQVIVPSPEFATDRTAFCVFRENTVDPQLLAVTRDGGRSWRRAEEAGLTRDGTSVGLGITLSPRFAADRMIFATVGTGTYASTDHGESFTLVDALAGGGRQGNPMPYLAPTLDLPVVAGDDRAVYLAYSAQYRTGRVDVARRLHEPAVGAPGLVGFAAPEPSAAPVAFGYLMLSPTDRRAVAYACTTALLCRETFTFPAGYAFGGSRDFWARPGGDGRTIYVRLHGGDGSAHIWRSRDGGLTYERWDAVERLLAPVNRTSGWPPKVSLTIDPRRARTMYLRVSGSSSMGVWKAGAPPAEQLFRTTDGGASWRRVGFRLGEGQRGRSGNLPWVGPTSGDDGSGIYAASGGALFAIGVAYDRPGTVFCSRDGGVRWARAC